MQEGVGRSALRTFEESFQEFWLRIQYWEMKTKILAMAFLSTQSIHAMSSESSKEALNKLMEAPLIAGASVSADYNSLSPGKTLALRYTAKSKILTRAQGGRHGVETVKTIKAEDFSN